MSTSNPPASTSSANFTKIFDAATNEYKAITGQDLGTHPFAAALERFNSPDDILGVFRTQAQSFERVYKGNERLMICLTPIVQILFTISAVLDNQPSPAKSIFTGIGILLGAVKDAIASYQVLIDTFERIHFFLHRLKNYTAVQLTPDLTMFLGKLMAQVLCILALSTKVMKERRIKKFMKRLVGRTDVEDALQRLNMLTQEENLMTTAATFQVAHQVHETVTEIKEVVRDVGGDTKATRETVQHVNQNVLTIKEVAYKTADGVDRVRMGMRNVNDSVEGARRQIDQVQRNQSQQKLRTWLKPPDPYTNHNIACNTHHEGTAGWFIGGTTFEEWKKNGSLLWVRGNPGSGKSILCSAIVEEIKQIPESSSALVAFYYFDFRDATKRDVRGLLTSVLIQLAEASIECWNALSQCHTDCKDGLQQPNEDKLARCLESMLDLLEQTPVYIIVDALDECPDQNGTPSAREKVLDFVDNLIQAKLPNLFVCITSRPEQDITEVFNPLTPPKRRVSLHEESGQKEDINRYVDAFVRNDKAMKRWRDGDKKRVIDALTERAGGMFRWVYCQLDTLRRCMPSSITRALRELPTSLDATYERALQGIPKEKQQHARRLFQCLVAAARPLTPEELAEVFAIQFDSDTGPTLKGDWRPENPEHALLSTCSTLIAVVDNGVSKVVQFSHFSVKEYLTSERLRDTTVDDIRKYYIPTNDAHAALAQACLTVLLQLDDKVDKAALAPLHLISYAAQHWADHARSEEVERQIEDILTRLFNPKRSHLRALLWINDVDSDTKRPIEDLDGHPSPKLEATPLYYAALCGLSWLSKYLITSRSEDVNAQCGRHGSPLHAASHKGHVTVVRVLLDNRASVNAPNRYRKTPMSLAYESKHTEVVELLLERGASVEGWFDHRGRLLHRASADGRTEVVKLLLRRKADVNAKGDMQWTPLHFAASHGHLDIAQKLVERKANVNAIVRDHGTPTHLASRRGHIKIVQLLLDNGADVHIRADDNKTPLETATSSGHKEIAELLKQYGAKSD